VTQEQWNCFQAILGVSNLLVLAMTAAIIWRYTKHTRDLLAAAQESARTSHASLDLERLNNRPFVVLTMSRDDDLRHLHLFVRNVGKGVATTIAVEEFHHGQLVKTHTRAALSAGGHSELHRYELTRDAGVLARGTEYAIRYRDLGGQSLNAPARLRVVSEDRDWLEWIGDSVE
jgi:hypothetical protein